MELTSDFDAVGAPQGWSARIYAAFDRRLVRPVLMPAAAAYFAVMFGVAIGERLTDSPPELLGILFAVILVIGLAVAPRYPPGDSESEWWKCVWPITLAMLLIVVMSAFGIAIRQSVGDTHSTAVAKAAIFAVSMVIVIVLFVRNTSLGKICERLLARLWVLLRTLGPLLFTLVLFVTALCQTTLPGAEALQQLSDWAEKIRQAPDAEHILQLVLPQTDALPRLVAMELGAVALFLAAPLAFHLLAKVPEHFWVIFAAALTILAIAFNLADGLRQAVGWAGFELPPFPSLNSTGNGDTQGQPIESTVGFLLALLSTGTLTVTASSALMQAIARIDVANGLTDAQIAAATRLRHRAIDAVPPERRLAALYPHETRITTLSKERSLPFKNIGGPHKTRVKLLINPGSRVAPSNDFDRRWIEHLMESQRGAIQQTLFFVYTSEHGRPSEAVCYCTGAEFLELSEITSVMPGSLRKVHEAFYDALNAGDAATVRRVAEHARQVMLNKQVGREVLMSSITERAGRELADVMETLSKAALARILLLGPGDLDEAILGAEEIASYLLKR